MRRALLAGLLVLLAADCCFAQTVTVSLPLQGYFRQGRYMPVRATASGAAATDQRVTLSADGAMPTELAMTGGDGKRVTVPLLVLGDSVSNLRASVPGRPDQPVLVSATPTLLGADERLVAIAGDASEAEARQAASLFPGARVVPVRLDTNEPALLAPAAAYEVLDGVVLDAPAAAKVAESQLGVLLAGGTVVAVRSEARPAGAWPWRRVGPYWVLRHEVAGPRDVVDADVYEPSYAWVRGWPGSVRRQAVLGAVVFAILATASTLWRSRRAVWAGLAVCIVGLGAAAGWAARISPVVRAGGDVAVRDPAGGLTQRDRWTYLSSLRPAEATEPFDATTRPVFFSRRFIAGLAPRLVCDGEGRPQSIRVSLREGRVLAFVSRHVSPQLPPAPLEAKATSPVRLLADRLYPGRVLGQAPPATADDDAAWPTVWTERVAPLTQFVD